MSTPRQPVDWNRLVVEGLVIVVSILLAFAIDAWWDQQREVRDAKDQVSRVVAELRANTAILQAQDQSLEYTTRAAREFLLIMGPEVEPVSTQDIGSMMYRIFGVPTLSLSNSATQNFLSSGQLTAGRWIDVRLALTELLSEAQVAENASLELREMRPEMLGHMQAFVSGLDVAKEHPLMADYPSSRFGSDTSALLSDIEFESLIAYYAIRMEINRRHVQALLDRHGAAIDMIENGQ
jgi:hypothetical protein